MANEFMNVINTPDSSPALPVWTDLTPPPNNVPGPTAATEYRVDGEVHGMVSMWKTMVKIQFHEDCILALLWICSMAAIVTCFLSLH